jgi:3-deoxy-D-manno-octulosonic-acid transferase
VDLVLAQNDEYAQRYRELGARNVEVAGNLKFDALPEIDEGEERKRWRARLGEQVLVGGSTHAPEEEILLDAYARLREKFPRLRLVLAPRHLERLEEVLGVVRAKGFTPKRLSEGAIETEVGVLDTMGELYKLYCGAAVAFVGGSFAPRGGQSVIEPASLGKPIVAGPGMENFADAAEKLDSLGALRTAAEPGSVAELVAEYLEHPERGEPGREWIRRSSGCTGRVAEALLKLL